MNRKTKEQIATLLATLVGAIALMLMIIGIKALVLYIAWNWICDTFLFAYWITPIQSLGLTLVISVIRDMIFPNKKDDREITLKIGG